MRESPVFIQYVTLVRVRAKLKFKGLGKSLYRSVVSTQRRGEIVKYETDKLNRKYSGEEERSNMLDIMCQACNHCLWKTRSCFQKTDPLLSIEFIAV